MLVGAGTAVLVPKTAVVSLSPSGVLLFRKLFAGPGPALVAHHPAWRWREGGGGEYAGRELERAGATRGP